MGEVGPVLVMGPSCILDATALVSHCTKRLSLQSTKDILCA